MTSLFWRLTLTYSLAFCVVASAGSLAFYHRVYSVTLERLDLELAEDTEKYFAVMGERGLAGVISRIKTESAMEDSREEFFRVLDLTGKVLFATDMSAWGDVGKGGVPEHFRQGSKKPVIRTLSLPERDLEARMISSVIGPNTILEIGESLEDADEYLGLFQTYLLALTVILVAVSVTIGWFIARKALADMEHVTHTAEEISRGAYDRRVEVKGRFNEIERLAGAFNTMLDRIQGLLKSMKEINDNIAHDLRSPLARIRGVAEMTLLDDKSLADYKEMAVSTMEESDTLIEMVNTMLDITEAEVNTAQVAREPFDLVQLLEEACELFRPLASEKQVALELNLPDSLAFQAVKKRMQRIVTNLLENAIKYNTEPGTVQISAGQSDGEIRIRFQDNGVGIHQDDLPHIFERFYQCDRSRSQGGVGLGLSLVKAYVESMNGRIEVESAPAKGSSFTLRFPSASV